MVIHIFAGFCSSTRVLQESHATGHDAYSHVEASSLIPIHRSSCLRPGMSCASGRFVPAFTR